MAQEVYWKWGNSAATELDHSVGRKKAFLGIKLPGCFLGAENSGCWEKPGQFYRDR